MTRIQFTMVVTLRKDVHGHEVLRALTPFLSGVGSAVGDINLMHTPRPGDKPLGHDRNPDQNLVLFEPVGHVLGIRFQGEDTCNVELKLFSSMRALESMSVGGFHYEMTDLRSQETWRECFGPSEAVTNAYRQSMLQREAQLDNTEPPEEPPEDDMVAGYRA